MWSAGEGREGKGYADALGTRARTRCQSISTHFSDAVLLKQRIQRVQVRAERRDESEHGDK
jgi:hypothetical protein